MEIEFVFVELSCNNITHSFFGVGDLFCPSGLITSIEIEFFLN